MNRRLNLGSVVLAVLAILVVPIAHSPLSAQVSSRFRVVVPNFTPQQGADRDFGEDLASELRGLLDDLATHRSVDDDDIEDAADRFDISMEDLNCVYARQLVNQTDLGQVIFCGSYVPQGGQYVVSGQIIEVQSGETVDVESVTVPQDGDRQAAQALFESFDRFVSLTRAAQFCAEYYQSDTFDRALTNCNQAIELNPEGTRSLYIRGLVHKDMDNLEDALEDMKAVLENDPVHEEALQWAGWLATTLGREEEGRQFYGQYLELNPDNASVRMNIAYDMAQQGDPEGAMLLLEEGLELAPDNLNLWQQLGGFAFRAGAERVSEQQAQGEQGMTAQAAEYYRKGIEAYQRVRAAQEEMAQATQTAQDTAAGGTAEAQDTVSLSAGQLRAMISAHIQLEQLDEAIRLAEEVLEDHPEEARLWAIYADALRRADRLDDALAALDRVREVDPDYPNLGIRQANWLLQAGRFQDAVPYLREAAEQGLEGDRIAQVLLSYGYSQGVQQQRFNTAIEAFETAKQYELSPEKQSEINFWHGWSIFKMAEAVQEPRTLETARRTLPWFQQARRLFQEARAYANSRENINLGQILNTVNQFIEIQELIIERGR